MKSGAVQQKPSDKLVQGLRYAGIEDEPVLAAIARIPREQFVPPTFQEHAYDDTALPIGQGQTVSQPLIVAMMTQALALTDRHKVLEIGTGSGYQSAVLAVLARRVYTIERHRPLLAEAEARFAALRIHKVTTRHGDGSEGWAEQAPFDRIIVTAAAEREVPPKLIDQLAVGGIMVVPVARSAIDQRLLKITKNADGLVVEGLGGVRFVPLVSERSEPLPPTNIQAALKRLKR